MLHQAESGKPDVLIVDGSSPRYVGGAETVRNEITQSLIRRGHRVVWYYPQENELRYDQSNHVPTGVETKGLRRGRLKYTKRYIDLEDTANIVRDINRRPSVLVANGYHDFCVPLMAAVNEFCPRSRIVQIYHGAIPPQDIDPNYTGAKKILAPIRNSLERANIRHVLNSPKVTNIAVSGFVADQAHSKLGVKNVVVCHPPSIVDSCPQVRKPEHKKRYNILDVTRRSPEKGLNLLATIAQATKEIGLPFDYTLVGPASDAQYDLQVRRMMEGCVTVTGAMVGEQLCQTYTNADLGIFTSPQEGRGLVTIEHHCHGNGVIATDIPPTREIFQNYSNPVGVLIDNTDPDRAARQSVEFLDAYQRNPILRQQISEEAFRARAIFDPALLTTTFVDTILGQV